MQKCYFKMRASLNSTQDVSLFDICDCVMWYMYVYQWTKGFIFKKQSTISVNVISQKTQIHHPIVLTHLNPLSFIGICWRTTLPNKNKLFYGNCCPVSFSVSLSSPNSLAWRPLWPHTVSGLDPLANVYFLVGGRLSDVWNHWISFKPITNVW